MLSTLFLLLSSLHPAAADIGPGGLMTAEGSSIVPGAQTQVRMEDERVEINIQAAINAEGKDNSFALVDAVFNMRNLGGSAERMRVKFPRNDASIAGMSGDEIKGFQAWVNGEAVEVSIGRELVEEPTRVDVSWAYFEALFPPGERVPVRVRYILQPEAEYVPDTAEASQALPGQFYDYTLVTGRDWQGTIGRAEIVVNFPYAVSAQNVTWHEAGSRLSGKQVTWVKEDFEPAEEDNYAIKIVPPADWLKKTGVEASLPVLPEDIWLNLLMIQMGYGAAGHYDSAVWLGDCYRQMALLTAPSGLRPTFRDAFAELGLEAYHKAVMFPTGRRAAYIGIAELLLAKSAPQVTPEQQAEILSALNQAQALPPDSPDYESIYADPPADERIAAVYQALQQAVSPGSPLPALNPPTAPLPTATLTPTSTAAPRPTRTLPPPPTVTVTRVKTSPPALEPAVRPEMTPTAFVSAASIPAQSAGWLLAGGAFGVGMILALVYLRGKATR